MEEIAACFLGYIPSEISGKIPGFSFGVVLR